ncbi:MAG: FliM/FliN family flagellar motor switch protein [Planctomycetota bacterium]
MSDPVNENEPVESELDSQNPVDESSEEVTPPAENVDDENDPNEEAAIETQSPQFAELPLTKSKSGSSMERFYDVSVNVSAEIGRVSMTLGELLRIGEGAVVKLDRQVSAPVELVAQGVRVASGDVVVVDDCFAVRIREIEKARN